MLHDEPSRTVVAARQEKIIKNTHIKTKKHERACVKCMYVLRVCVCVCVLARSFVIGESCVVWHRSRYSRDGRGENDESGAPLIYPSRYTRKKERERERAQVETENKKEVPNKIASPIALAASEKDSNRKGCSSAPNLLMGHQNPPPPPHPHMKCTMNE